MAEVQHFFVSYTQTDRRWAEWIAWVIEDAGHKATVQAWDFGAGKNFVEEMHDATRECDRLVAVLSPAYERSKFSRDEWTAVFAEDSKRLLPVRVRDYDPTGLLGPLVYVDLVDAAEDKAKEELVDAISGERRKPETAPSYPGASKAKRSSPAPTFPGGLPPVWTVPYRRNPHFTGRVQQLEELHSALCSKREAALTALHGLGGVGKTQLALEYLYRHKSDYEVVGWIEAETPESLSRDVGRLAAEIGLDEAEEPDQEVIAAAVRDWCERHGSWILVFDNAADPDLLRRYLPRDGRGHVLITSRRHDWGRIGSSPVRPFERTESVEFLDQRADGKSSDELAEVLGDLPLALEQALAYMRETALSTERYLELFRQRRSDMLQRGQSEDYPETVAATWQLSFDQVEAGSPVAADLLRLVAFLAPENLPRDLLTEGAEHLPDRLGEAAKDGLELLDAEAVASRYSLIDVADDSLSMHRLVQAVARDGCDEAARERWSGVVVRMLESAFSHDEHDPKTWERAGRLLPHAVMAAGHGEAAKPEIAAGLLNVIGGYLKARHQLSTALEHRQRALRIAEEVLGAEHSKVAWYANDVGLILRMKGDLTGALEYYQQALNIGEAVHGLEHQHVATYANNIGVILQAQGDLAGAVEYLERALAIDEALYGPEHPKVAIRANNIGQILKAQGDLSGALEYSQRALCIDEAVYGTEHPNVARDLNNIGLILKAQGDLSGALEYSQRALVVDEAVYGPEHPDVAIDANNLGRILQAQGDLEGALENIERAHSILERTFGPDNPRTRTAAKNLAALRKAMEAANSSEDPHPPTPSPSPPSRPPGRGGDS